METAHVQYHEKAYDTNGTQIKNDLIFTSEDIIEVYAPKHIFHMPDGRYDKVLWDEVTGSIFINYQKTYVKIIKAEMRTKDETLALKSEITQLTMALQKNSEFIDFCKNNN